MAQGLGCIVWFGVRIGVKVMVGARVWGEGWVELVAGLGLRWM